MRPLVTATIVAATLIAGAARQTAAIDPSVLAVLSWRSIGPFHAGRTVAVAGVISQPSVFYAGAAHGGVWKTGDYGRTWIPLFDQQSTGTIGALAVAPSDANVVYAGTAHGVFRSADAGRSWTALGLTDAQQIVDIVVDPRDASRVFVAALGHEYGANAERGVYRSTDGRTFTRVLYKNDDTGAVDVAIDPANNQVLYAVLWQTRQAPWEGGEFSGAGSGLYKSTDGGATWRALTSGLPASGDDRLGRMAIAIAPTRPARLVALVEAERRGGVYRSDDAGETWTLANSDTRVALQGAQIEVDPKSADVFYTVAAAVWRSTDGGGTFRIWRPASGGDYRRLWINPSTPETMILAGDRGAPITQNAGSSWSSRLTLPTAEFAQVNADGAAPYRICGVERASGAGCLPSRSERGAITAQDWMPLGTIDGVITPDPADADLAFAGRVLRLDRRSGQTQDVSPPRSAAFRAANTAPLMFSPIESRTLFFAANTLWRTATGGQTWTEISPDLSRDAWTAPETVGVYRHSAAANFSRRGVISAMAASYVDPNTIWAGTDDGLLHVTRDGGKTWIDSTPPQLPAWGRVAGLEASHFDANTAYAAIDMTRLDDMRPYLYRTRDGGRTWTHIVQGLPTRGVFRVVREDASRRGLLFAGSDAVFVSLDDGEQWQPLRLNMPFVPIRDLVVKDADVIVATEGRGLWILDDIMPIRQVTADVIRAPAYIFRPPVTSRFRANRIAAPRLLLDEPAASNPPDGVTITYALGAPPEGPISLEIIETATGELIRRFTSDDPRPSARLNASPGVHRVVWDVRYTPPPLDGPGDATLPGAWVLPGTYQVRLTVGGRPYRQAVVVRMDPRVKVSVADLTAQLTLSKTVANMMTRLLAERVEIDRALADAAGENRAKLTGARAALTRAYTPLPALFEALQRADAKPTAPLEAAVQAAIKTAEAALTPGIGMSESD